jgi:cell division protein FtsI/penicillin-binding protein 2
MNQTMHTSEKVSSSRISVLFTALVMVAAVMGVRVVDLVRHSQADVVEQVDRQQRMVIPVPARPGGIWARTGQTYRLLASSRQSPLVFVDPLMIPDDRIVEVSNQLGRIVRVQPREIAQTILDRRNARYVVVKRDLTAAQVEKVRDLKMSSMLGLTYEWKRQYPSDSLASHVVGFCLADGSPGGALELSMRRYLEATPGTRVLSADARRRAIDHIDTESTPPVDGADVYLTLDVIIQGYLEEAVAEAAEAHGAPWATGVVIEPETGRVLAMASSPTYDPNRFNQTDPETWTNHTITSPYEPGSVVKPLFAAAAVDAGIVEWDTMIDCENGTYYAHRGGRITDHGQEYDQLSVEQGVVQSSNILMAKLGEMMGNDRLYAVTERFGFGMRTGIELPGESPGIIRPLGNWDGYSTRRVPFGQEMSANSLQVAMAFGALANGGKLMKPILVDHIRSGDEVIMKNEPTVVRRVVREQTARESLDVMALVVEEGTGKKARMQQWRSFGKTGTAQIAGPGGYVDGAYVGSFVGGAPVEQPRAVCLISVYWPDRSNGYYGGTVAAPYVKRVLEKTLTYLDVPSDRYTVPADR